LETIDVPLKLEWTCNECVIKIETFSNAKISINLF
jgi:hypothetical protein